MAQQGKSDDYGIGCATEMLLGMLIIIELIIGGAVLLVTFGIARNPFAGLGLILVGAIVFVGTRAIIVALRALLATAHAAERSARALEFLVYRRRQ